MAWANCVLHLSYFVIQLSVVDNKNKHIVVCVLCAMLYAVLIKNHEHGKNMNTLKFTIECG